MPDETIQATQTTQRQTGEVTDPAEISKILGELAERKALLFFSEIGADRCFVATAIALDARCRTLRVAALPSPDDRVSICTGNKFDVFVPNLKAELVFATLYVEAVSKPEDNTFDLAMPSRLRLGSRREHLRGSCFGLVDILMRRKDQAQDNSLRASLNDISNTGCGIYLPEGINWSVRAGDNFDDCVLLLNNKPMATCTLEVLHTRRNPETGSQFAGGRFTDLNSTAKSRIAQLVATLDPLWDTLPPQPTKEHLDCAK